MEKKYVLSSGNASSDGGEIGERHRSGDFVKPVENNQNMLKDLEQIALCCANNGIRLGAHSLFYAIDTATRFGEVVIGDCKHVWFSKDTCSEFELWENLKSMKCSLLAPPTGFTGICICDILGIPRDIVKEFFRKRIRDAWEAYRHAKQKGGGNAIE